MTKVELMELAEECSDVLTAMEDDLLLNIAEYLAEGSEDMPTAKWKMQQLAALGKLDSKNLRTIAEYMGIAPDMAEIAVTRAALKAVKEMDEGFSELAREGIINDTEVPMEDSALQAAAMYSKQAADRLNKVNTVMRYFAKAQAMAAVNRITEILDKQQHLDILNKAAGKVIMGTESRQTAVRQCIREMSQRGIPAFVDAAGRQWSPEAYVNMDIRTTCSNAAHEAQFTRMDDYGIDLIEVSSHAGARPKCAKDQGKIFDRKGKSKKYPSWKTSSYGEPDGILGINCGHQIYPFIEGVSVQTYFPYDDKENDALYKKKQGQRKLERDVRSAKREAAMLKAAGDDEGARLARAAVKQKTAVYNEYCRKNGLSRKADRLTVIQTNSFKKVSVNQTPFFTADIRANRKIIDSENYIDKFRGLTKFGLGDKNVMRNAREIINDCDNSKFEELRLLKVMSGKMIEKPIMLGEDGSDNISLPINGYRKDSLILIHNHPNGTAFSFADFLTLNDCPEIQTMIAVGHNGTVYRLSVGKGRRLDIKTKEDYNYYEKEWQRAYSLGEGDISAVIQFAKTWGWNFEYT